MDVHVSEVRGLSREQAVCMHHISKQLPAFTNLQSYVDENPVGGLGGGRCGCGCGCVGMGVCCVCVVCVRARVCVCEREREREVWGVGGHVVGL